MKWKNLACTTTYFVTATITQWQPLLAEDAARRVVLEGFEFYRRKYGYRLLAYVVMPEHYHAVVELHDAADLHSWLHDIQLHTANQIAKWLKCTATAEQIKVFADHANGSAKLAIWKEQARAVPITSEDVLRTKIEYIHANPVKRGLVDDPSLWPWSSWRNYYMDDATILRVDRVDCL